MKNSFSCSNLFSFVTTLHLTGSPLGSLPTVFKFPARNRLCNISKWIQFDEMLNFTRAPSEICKKFSSSAEKLLKISEWEFRVPSDVNCCLTCKFPYLWRALEWNFPASRRSQWDFMRCTKFWSRWACTVGQSLHRISEIIEWVSFSFNYGIPTGELRQASWCSKKTTQTNLVIWLLMSFDFNSN